MREENYLKIFPDTAVQINYQQTQTKQFLKSTFSALETGSINKPTNRKTVISLLSSSLSIFTLVHEKSIMSKKQML
jgi:hypothetical protein